MQIIKKIEPGKSMDSINDSLMDLPCHGACLQSEYSIDGSFTINGIPANDFVDLLTSSILSLNIHLYNQRRLTDEDYQNISRAISRIDSVPSIILSSSQLSRQTLNEFRKAIVGIQKKHFSKPEIFVASSDDLTNNDVEKEDILYSTQNQSRMRYELGRIILYDKIGIRTLLDWQDNNGKRLSRIIERTDNSDRVMVLTTNPKNIRGVIRRTI